MRRLVIDLDPGSDPIQGRLTAARGRASAFSGWMQLSVLIDAASGEDGSMHPTVREARLDDVSELGEMARDSFVHAHRDHVPPALYEYVARETYSDSALRAAIERSAALVLVAEVGDRLVGYLYFERHEDRAELHQIYTRVGEDRRGLGSQLIDELERRLPGGTVYELITTAGNTRARAFYARRGFELTERTTVADHYPSHKGVQFPPGMPNVDAVVLRRRL